MECLSQPRFRGRSGTAAGVAQVHPQRSLFDCCHGYGVCPHETAVMDRAQLQQRNRRRSYEEPTKKSEKKTGPSTPQAKPEAGTGAEIGHRSLTRLNAVDDVREEHGHVLSYGHVRNDLRTQTVKTLASFASYISAVAY